MAEMQRKLIMIFLFMIDLKKFKNKEITERSN